MLCLLNVYGPLAQNSEFAIFVSRDGGWLTGANVSAINVKVYVLTKVCLRFCQILRRWFAR
jgi:hypothetical protein